MLHSIKVQRNLSFGSREEYFDEFLPYMGMAAIVIYVTFLYMFVSLSMKFEFS